MKVETPKLPLSSGSSGGYRNSALMLMLLMFCNTFPGTGTPRDFLVRDGQHCASKP